MLIFEIIGIISNNTNIDKLKRLGLLIGYTFQIKDDLNDALNTSIGKDNGIDINKSTINKIVGIDNTKLMCSEFLDEINSLIKEIFSNKTLLKYINMTL
jgi:geranylgeranyl pyrophosphate synthase